MIRKFYSYSLLLLASIFLSCVSNSKQITDQNDYSDYLSSTDNKNYKDAGEEFNFWNIKYQESPNQHPYLLKMANTQSVLFQSSGQIEHLRKAEEYLHEANRKTNFNTAAYLRSLAHNLISQHRFQEALKIIAKGRKKCRKAKGNSDDAF